ncbi:Uma2 family endonuclease [Mucilaginibacter endophyticus]|uniref:Uma2 family endonuclease n=1 Tax=Mucilaginibacter endophyticus TaxID=2675003 RepID=UPI00137B6EAD|nr:Uma2 family endonuclease [Mucilaginibacter endophyticus]
MADKKITLDEYMAMPIGAPYQYINGFLIDWPSRTVPHQIALGNFVAAIINYEDKIQNRGIYLIGPIEVILDDKNSYKPDFIYIAKERRDILKDYIYGAPDLVVEILWEKNAYYDLRPKKDIYEKYGVKEYIIIDPIQQNADLYMLKDGAYILGQKAQLGEVLKSLQLPDFDIEVSKLFQ